jgi:hypothetical protein
VLSLAAAFLQIPQHLHSPIIEAWKRKGRRPLKAFAPYAAHVVAVELFFQFGLAAHLIASNRPSNRTDIAYLFYLPFCTLFASSDNLHRRTAPHFLRPDQEFVWGHDLKAGLKAVNTHFLQVPEEQREKGIMSFADWHRRLDQIEAEGRLDGIYVIRTNVPAEHLCAAETVQAYKDLSRVERAFRSLKSVDLDIRPIRHWSADRVRAHVFLCMLAYHVEWHLRDALAPLLFHDTDLAAAKAERTSPVAATEPSDAVKAKKATKRSAEGQRVMGFADLMAHLGTLVRNTMRVPARPKHRFTLHSKPTALQQAAFEALGLDPVRVRSVTAYSQLRRRP